MSYKLLLPSIHNSSHNNALKRMSQHNQLTTPNNVCNNLAFHRLLTEGIALEIHKDGNSQGKQVWLIDWNEPSNNEFLVINQLTITHDSPKGKYKRRPDLILYINGIPLVVIELKTPPMPTPLFKGRITKSKPTKPKSPTIYLQCVLRGVRRTRDQNRDTFGGF